MEAHIALQGGLFDEAFRDGEDVPIELDRLHHRARPHLPPHHDHGVPDVRPDFDQVPRPPRPQQHAHRLRNLGVGDRMPVLGGVLLDAREQSVAGREEGVEVLGLRELEDFVDAGFHGVVAAQRGK